MGCTQNAPCSCSSWVYFPGVEYYIKYNKMFIYKAQFKNNRSAVQVQKKTNTQKKNKLQTLKHKL